VLRWHPDRAGAGEGGKKRQAILLVNRRAKEKKRRGSAVAGRWSDPTRRELYKIGAHDPGEAGPQVVKRERAHLDKK